MCECVCECVCECDRQCKCNPFVSGSRRCCPACTPTASNACRTRYPRAASDPARRSSAPSASLRPWCRSEASRPCRYELESLPLKRRVLQGEVCRSLHCVWCKDMVQGSVNKMKLSTLARIRFPSKIEGNICICVSGRVRFACAGWLSEPKLLTSPTLPNLQPRGEVAPLRRRL